MVLTYSACRLTDKNEIKSAEREICPLKALHISIIMVVFIQLVNCERYFQVLQHFSFSVQPFFFFVVFWFFCFLILISFFSVHWVLLVGSITVSGVARLKEEPNKLHLNWISVRTFCPE